MVRKLKNEREEEEQDEKYKSLIALQKEKKLFNQEKLQLLLV